MAYKSIFSTTKPNTSVGYQSIFGNKPTTKTAVNQPPKILIGPQPIIPIGPLPALKAKTVSLPEYLGGGEYQTAGPGTLIKEERSQDALKVKEDSERDHIISVALGGTSNPKNLQYLLSPETPEGKWISEKRQQGKYKVEIQAIDDYKAGKISLPEARAKVAYKQQEIKGLIPEQGTMAYLPNAIDETIGKFSKGVLKFGEAVLQAPQRALISVGIQPIADILGKEAEYQPKSKLEKALLGEESIRGVRVNLEKAQTISKELSKKVGFDEDTSIGMSLAIAPLFVGGMLSTDLSPIGGGGKNAIKKIASSKNSDEILGILKTIFKKADDANLKPLADELVNVSDVNKIETLFKNTNELNKFIKPIKETSEEIIPKLDPLAQEATKYKSAGKTMEQKAIKTFYETKNPKEALYITSDGKLIDGTGKNQVGKSEWKYMNDRIVDHREIAQDVTNKSGSDALIEYMNETGNIRFSMQKDGTLNLDVSTMPNGQQLKAVENAFKKGNGTIMADISGQKGENIASGEFTSVKEYKNFLDKYKSQLTDIWNKANKGVKEAGKKLTVEPGAFKGIPIERGKISTPKAEKVKPPIKKGVSEKNFTITLDNGEEINVKFEKNSFGGSTDHFEFRTEGPNSISETGYKSHFVKLEKGTNPEEAATIIGNTMAKEEAISRPKRAREMKKLGLTPAEKPTVVEMPTLKFEEIKTKPELFQQSRSLEKLESSAGFEEYKVGEVLKDFDEQRLLNNPITVGDINGDRERGFITSVKREMPQLKVAGQYIPRPTDPLATKAKNLIKSDLEVSERIARNYTDDNSVAIGTELLKYYSDEADKTAVQALKNLLNDKAAELANTMARNLTEAGRTVQAASILSRLTPEGQIRFAAREIQKYNEKAGFLGRKKIPELTGDQAKKIADRMKIIKGMPDNIEKAKKFQELKNYISDLVPTPLWKKMTTVWKAGLLTGIKTHGLNIFSNLTHFATEIVKDVPAVVVDSVASLFTGKRTLGLTVKGVPSGVKDGFIKGWQYLKTGFDERNIAVKLDYKRINFGKSKIARALQRYEETIFHLMGAEDQPFYYGAKARSLQSQAIARAKNIKLKGLEAKKFIDEAVANPTDEMLKYATLDAETSVFQNQTYLGKAATGIQKIPGGEIIVPFGRTPSAAAMQTLNYSPVGIVKSIAVNIGRGRFDQRLFSQGIGRGLVGTGILYIGAELFKKGMISLDRPTGEKEQKLWELEGRQPNSIKINGKWRQAQVLGPAGNLLLIGGHFQNEFNKSGSPTEAISKAMAGSAKSFTEQTFLRGMSQTIDALVDPSRSAEGYAGSTLASTIPTIVSDVARAIDDKERRAESIPQRFQARIPGWRETLEPQVTVFGQERDSVGNFLEILADPTRPSPIIVSPTVSELRRLTDAGFPVSPTLLGDKKGYPFLTPEQNTDLWKRAGEITQGKVTNLMASPKYNDLPDDERAKAVDSFVEKSKILARAEKLIELTQGLQGEELKAKLSELKKAGLMTREVFDKYLELK